YANVLVVVQVLFMGVVPWPPRVVTSDICRSLAFSTPQTAPASNALPCSNTLIAFFLWLFRIRIGYRRHSPKVATLPGQFRPEFVIVAIIPRKHNGQIQLLRCCILLCRFWAKEATCRLVRCAK